MKKALSILGVATILASCGDSNSYTINGDVNGINDGTKVYIEKIDVTTGMPIKVDSTEVKNNTFAFKGKADNIEQSFITFSDQEGRVPFILEKGKISFTYNLEDITKSGATGTKNNDEFSAFSKTAEELNRNIVQYQADNQTAFMQAKEKEDREAAEGIINGFMKLAEKLEDYTDNYIDENPNSYTTLIILAQNATSGAYQKEELIEKYNKLDKTLQETTVGKAFKVTLDQMPDAKIKIGDKAPDFSAKSPEGKEISLKESLGKVTIIDFWASWCGPCRSENPKVVAIYNQYHDKGLNIIGVSLDKDSAKWIEAIAKDKLTWNHVSNLMFWQDPIAQEYEIKAIPATFILDENGVVVAKNLRGKKLEAKIQELLK
ncbi:TlpA disulfide reductase family protein [Myroides phaeus]|uniref:Peroxiredoxin n=1 Tax=Myroides phaeus TaxID=702745 RepID=A0A1G8GKN1_9FLAO|nr:TlpA disulfide reductase family protein [Myroides phaeus]SDH94871.1 Peroxiredoxin [Myroides phaeus]